MIKTSQKATARLLTYLMKVHHCRRVVVSPGSRNAPMIQALSAHEDMELYSVPDERAAAFTALGLTLSDRQAAAVLCTSGSAAANYLPAIAEAYYQQAPLLILTADRPLEMVDQGIGQTIQQQNLYENHVMYAAQLLRDREGDALALRHNEREINRALLALHRGPAHLNIPFEEPLYNLEPWSPKEQFTHWPHWPTEPPDLKAQAWDELAKEWQAAERIWIVAGMMPEQPGLAKALDELQDHSPVVLFTETTANLHEARGIHSIDRFVNTLSPEQRQKWRPDLVLTLGGEIISKMVKNYLGSGAPVAHWQVAHREPVMDAMGQLCQYIPVEPLTFVQAIHQRVASRSNAYGTELLRRNEQLRCRAETYWQEAPFSDLKVMGLLRHHLPKGAALHCANSASIRYAQLFDWPQGLRHHANRGTSGIDGCTATAIGQAMSWQGLVLLVTGDVAFQYDSNAFWNDRLPAHFRCLVLNNGGGNIFRIIAGPEKDQSFERFQETPHHLQLQAIAQNFNLPYRAVENEAGLEGALPEFLSRESEGPRILEVHTPRMENPDILARFFKYMTLAND